MIEQKSVFLKEQLCGHCDNLSINKKIPAFFSALSTLVSLY